MKKIIYALLTVILFSISTSKAQVPEITIILNDGTVQRINANEISNIQIENAKVNELMCIYQYNVVDKFLSKAIDSIVINPSNFSMHITCWDRVYDYSPISVIDSIKFIELPLNNSDTVRINNQVWQLRNLDVDHYRNGDSIPEIRDRQEWAGAKYGAWCYYDNDTVNKKYGKLYNYYAISDPRGLAPKNWTICDSKFFNHDNTEFFLKSCPDYKIAEDGYWSYSDEICTNYTGFSAVPTGVRLRSGTFKGLHTDCILAFADTTALEMNNYFDPTIGTNAHLNAGFTVRCVKFYPELFALFPRQGLPGDTMTIYGEHLKREGGTAIFTLNNQEITDIIAWDDSKIVFRIPLNAISGTIRLILNDLGSNEIKLRISDQIETITIGNQVWMKYNLDVDKYSNGDSLSDTELGKWRLPNDSVHYLNSNGRLYNQYAMNDSRGLIPTGWHVPSVQEWQELTDYLTAQGINGTKEIASLYGFDFINSRGGIINNMYWTCTKNEYPWNEENYVWQLTPDYHLVKETLYHDRYSLFFIRCIKDN